MDEDGCNEMNFVALFRTRNGLVIKKAQSISSKERKLSWKFNSGSKGFVQDEKYSRQRVVETERVIYITHFLPQPSTVIKLSGDIYDKINGNR